MQRIIILCVLMAYNTMMNACNICGCSAMSGTPGILPKFRSHFIGLRQSLRNVEASHPVSLLNPTEKVSNERYNSTELWGRWYPTKRLQVFGFLPYNQFARIEDHQTTAIAGLGDLTILVNYLVFNTGDSSGNGYKHALLIGSGAKLKTGRFNRNESAGFQLGSGSIDNLIYLSYTARLSKIGLLNEAQYRWMGTNPNKYQFGDKSTWSSKLFYWLSNNRMSFLPHIGYSFETSQYDVLNSIRQAKTGSKIQLLGAGIDIYYKDFAMNANYSYPIQQTINAGLVKESHRLQLNIIYNFNFNKKQCN